MSLLQVILPVIVMLVIGMICRERKLISQEGIDGLQALVISLLAHKDNAQSDFVRTLIGVALGVVIMVVGYTLGRAFIYSTPAYAVMKLPFQILQAVVGAVVGLLLCFKTRLLAAWEKFCK